VSSCKTSRPLCPSLRNGRCNAGSNKPALVPPLPAADRSPSRRGRISPTTSGRRMPPNRYAYNRASVSAGCASSTNVRVPSCGREFSPQGKWLTVPPAQVQDEFRQAFRRWGRPATMRVDNGGPWGSDGDWPPDLGLWLIGCGLAVHDNDPHSPTQNAVVERSQGTSQRWGEPGSCVTPEELQERLQYADTIQRERYPSINGQSRAAAYPGLRHSGRPYSLRWENEHWDVHRVLEHLSGYVAVRRVDKNGKVSLYHRPYYVGTLHRGKDIYVMVDPERGEWVFADLAGQQLRSVPAEELRAERIRSLTVTNRR
jgi:hypothetical protein